MREREEPSKHLQGKLELRSYPSHCACSENQEGNFSVHSFFFLSEIRSVLLRLKEVLTGGISVIGESFVV